MNNLELFDPYLDHSCGFFLQISNCQLITVKRKGLCSFGSALTVSISWNDRGCSLSCLLLISFCLLSLYAVRSRSLLIYEEPHQLEEPSSPISFADRNDRQTDTSKFTALSLEAVSGTQQDDIMQFTIANETRLEKSVLLGLQQHRWVQGGLLVTRVFHHCCSCLKARG